MSELSVSPKIQQYIRKWYQFQLERETLQNQVILQQQHLFELKEQQDPIEEQIIDELNETKNQKRPLQIGNDTFCIQTIPEFSTFTFSHLEQILLNYFAGDEKRRNDCCQFIKSQQKQNCYYHQSIVRFPRTSSTLFNMDS